MTHPYENIPKSAFWRGAVAGRETRALPGIWQPKHPLEQDTKVASYGSCFAQHIGKALAARGRHWVQSEPAPHGLRPEHRAAFGYDLFSSRTGNIYTSSMLLNWCRWALMEEATPREVWQGEDGLIDPVRAGLEPGGFADRAEFFAARQTSLAAFRNAVETADLFVFTLGLTESWVNNVTKMEYQICPGTIAGQFDPSVHVFVNMGFLEVLSSLEAAFDLLRAANGKLKFLLTVSPVPLTATASGRHVLTATTYSKSVLRAVAGEMATRHRDVDYFPSYELITAPTMRGSFYSENQRSVPPAGVQFVMRHFFEAEGVSAAKPAPVQSPSEADLICEEEILDAFGDTR